MLFVNFLKKNAEAGQAFFKKLLLVLNSFHIVCMLQIKVCIPCDDEDYEINLLR